MPGFRNFRALGDAENGARRFGTIRKVPANASVAGWYVDLSSAAGIPRPDYYSGGPLEASLRISDRGIFHGHDVSPAKKFLTGLSLCTPTAGLVGDYNLLDYLLYYPSIDMDDTSEQVFDNTIPLSRYTDGDGVQAMLVAQTPTTGGGQFTFKYDDKNDVERTSQNIFCSTAVANIASLITSEPATVAGGLVFLPLAGNGASIKRAKSITFTVPNGGLAALVLVKVVDTHKIAEINIPNEINYPEGKIIPPNFHTDAYLNFIVGCTATVAAGILTGNMQSTFG